MFKDRYPAGKSASKDPREGTKTDKREDASAKKSDKEVRDSKFNPNKAKRH